MKSTFDEAMLSAAFGQDRGIELRSNVRGLRESSMSGLTQEQKDRKLREACEGFESIFIQKMWQQMRATLPKNGLLHGGMGEEYWQGMYDQELAKTMSSAGGIGLADMMFSQLSRNLVSASRGTASARAESAGGGFAVSLAPLVPPRAAEERGSVGRSAAKAAEAPAEPAGGALAASIYDGAAPVTGVTPADGRAAAPNAVPDAAAAAGNAALPATAPIQAGDQASPEVLQALAQLRARQELDQRKPRRTTGSGDQLTGLQMAQQAHRDAGDKLGRGAVRPARGASSARGRQARQAQAPAAVPMTLDAGFPAVPEDAAAPAAPSPSSAMEAAMTSPAASSIPPLTPQASQASQTSMTAAQTAIPAPQGETLSAAHPDDVAALAGRPDGAATQGDPVTSRIRYSTNIPRNGKQSRKNEMIRTMNAAAEDAAAAGGTATRERNTKSTAGRSWSRSEQGGAEAASVAPAAPAADARRASLAGAAQMPKSAAQAAEDAAAVRRMMEARQAGQEGRISATPQAVAPLRGA